MFEPAVKFKDVTISCLTQRLRTWVSFLAHGLQGFAGGKHTWIIYRRKIMISCGI